MAVSEEDLEYLRLAVDWARRAVEAGDEPFGSVLVSGGGEVLFADHNHVLTGDGTRHPELEIARWAGAHLTLEERAAATVYTSGEHCAMCSAAHAWVGLGRIVFATSGEQTAAWRSELGMPAPLVRPLGIADATTGIPLDGPVPQLADEVRDLHRRQVQALRGQASR